MYLWIRFRNKGPVFTIEAFDTSKEKSKVGSHQWPSHADSSGLVHHNNSHYQRSTTKKFCVIFVMQRVIRRSITYLHSTHLIKGYICFVMLPTLPTWLRVTSGYSKEVIQRYFRQGMSFKGGRGPAFPAFLPERLKPENCMTFNEILLQVLVKVHVFNCSILFIYMQCIFQ